MAQHGKKYIDARGQIDRETTYSPVDAVKKLKTLPAAKFDETVEVHFRLGLNVRHADEQLRGTLMLPHGTGRETRVAVFAEGDKAREAEEAGADVVGSAEPNRDKVGRLSRAQVRQIAETKLVDLNARDVDQAARIIAGTARSMGVEVDL